MTVGVGNPNARVMIIGDAYGTAEEEQKGVPFLGAAGHELNKMLEEAGLFRSTVYLTNVVNRRPPSNDLSNWVAEKKKDIKPN